MSCPARSESQPAVDASILVLPENHDFVVLREPSTLFIPGHTHHEVEQLELQRTKPDAITTEPRPSSAPARPFSPDHQIEALLQRDNLHSDGDEISAEYLKIDAKFITDGQGVVPGVLLVTPQTVMFNPSVSDHLVIERGREAYLIRTPMKAVRLATFYDDIAAMVLGEASSRISPHGKAIIADDSVANGTTDASDTSLTRPSVDDTLQSDTTTCIQTTEQHPSAEMSSVDVSSIVDDFDGGATGETSLSDVERQQTPSDLVLTLDDVASTETSTPRHRLEKAHTIAVDMDVAARGSEDVSCADLDASAESLRHADGNELSDSDANSRRRKHDGSSVGRSHLKIFHEGEVDSETRDVSKDSGFSGSDFSSLSRNSIVHGGRNRTDIGAHPTANPGRRMIRSSSLSEEAKVWLGKRGVRLPSDSEVSETFPTECDDLTVPRPAKPINNQLIYVALKVRKSFWSPHDHRENSIMGLPPNRDQQRRENWFAVPKRRVDHLYSFLLTWCPHLHQDDMSLSQDEASGNEEGLSFIENKYSSSPGNSFFVGNSKTENGSSRSRASTNEVYPGKAVPIRSSVEDDLPELSEDCQLLTKKQIGLVSRQLPSRTIGHSWNLSYSTAVHGISLRTLYRNMEHVDSPVLLIIKDEEKQIFGAFVSKPPVVSDGFYGTGESMLFSFKSETELKVYRWSGENYFFIKGDPHCLTIGGGDGQVGLWLDEDLFHGRSHSCKTFDNETLSHSEDFVCSALEAWTFV